MPTKPAPDSPEELWQSQTEEETDTMTLSYVRHHVGEFQRTIHRRNVREAVSGVVATAVFGGCAWWLPNLWQKGGALVALVGVAYTLYDIRSNGGAREVPAAASASDCLAFHRQELTRQRDLLRRAGTRHIASLVPGLGMMLAGTGLQAAAANGLWIWAITVGCAGAVLALVSWLNLWAAARLQRDIDALEE